MASLYERPNSPFIWIKYKDESGAQKAHSTGLRSSVPSQKRKAEILRQEKHLIELKTEKGKAGDAWDEWVLEVLNRTYAHQQETLKRYNTSWRNLQPFLLEQKVTRPSQLTFRHCELYMDWRKESHPGVYKCGHNTARYDLVVVLHLLCDYAVKRGFINRNPCSSLGIPKLKPNEKPELTGEDIALIREKLLELKMPEWMKISFEIATHQGCRLRETSIPLSKINLEKKTITFKAKGSKVFTAPMHPDLLPLFKKLKKSGASVTCVIPKMASKEWWRFFRKIGLHQKGISFHCTRVTLITRLIRDHVPEFIVRKIVNHASTEVNRIYQRIGVDDVVGYLDNLKF